MANQTANMTMEVVIDGKSEQRQIANYEVSNDLQPPIRHPKLFKGEKAFLTFDGKTIILRDWP